MAVEDIIWVPLGIGKLLFTYWSRLMFVYLLIKANIWASSGPGSTDGRVGPSEYLSHKLYIRPILH